MASVFHVERRMTRAHERTAPVLRADVLTAPAMFHVERATGSAQGPPAFAHPSDVPISVSSGRLPVPRGTVRQKNCARIRPRRALPVPAPHGRQRASRMGEPHPLSAAMRQHILLLRMGESNSLSTTTRLCRPLFHVEPRGASRMCKPHPLRAATHQRLFLHHMEPRWPARMNEPDSFSATTWFRPPLFHVEPRKASRMRERHPLRAATHQHLFLIRMEPSGPSRMNEPDSFSATTWFRPPLFHVEPREASRMREPHPLSGSTYQHLFFHHMEPRGHRARTNRTRSARPRGFALPVFRMEPRQVSRMNKPNPLRRSTHQRLLPVPRGTTSGIAHGRAAPARRGHLRVPSSCSTWNHERHRA